MDALCSQKSILRDSIKEKAKLISFDDRIEKSQKIIEKIESMDEYKKAKTVFCFIGGELEVDTMPLIEKALCSGKKVAVPLCVSKGVMEARLITELSRLSKGRYKIMEPSLDSPVVSPKEIDFGVIPCVSCNEKGERLGHGGGYYDRFMQDTDFFKALICFSCLMTDKIPVEEHDITVDAVIHEEKIIIL